MSCNVTLFYSGSNTSDTPGLWSGKTVAQLAGVPPSAGLMYSYVKQVMQLFRAAGAWPDLVAIGNEVNTGMFTKGITGGVCTPNGTGGGACFAPIQIAAMQAILDAASDTSNPALLGPPLPPPLRCIHPDGGPDLQNFFNGAVNTNHIPLEVACESYYPGWHGPLTQTQSSWHNATNQHVGEVNMATQANGLGLPLFTIEDGVSYTTSGRPQDQWYVPTTRSLSRQAMIDLNRVQKNMPHNLSMGMEWWAGEATPIAGITALQGFWATSGITLFDASTTSGNALDNATLPVMLAMGGKLDPTLTYKFVSAVNGRILETAGASTAPAAALRTALDTGITGPHQRWQILAQGANPYINAAVYPTVMDHRGDGYFQIVNMNQTSGLKVLDTNGGAAGGPVVQNSQTADVDAITGTNAAQEWDIMTVGNCGDIPANCTAPPLTTTGNYYMIVNKATGRVLAASGTGGATAIQQQAPAAASNTDWVVPANKGQLWQIFPVHINATPAVVSLSTTASRLVFSRLTQTFNGTVTIKNNGAGTINGPFQIVVSSLTSGVTLLNATDTFKGSPFITVPAVVTLAPGQSATINVQFSKPPKSGPINFTPIAYVGSI